MDEKSKEVGRLDGTDDNPPQEAPLASPGADKPKGRPRQLTCWKCQQDHRKHTVFMSTDDHFRFKDGRKLCSEHKVVYMQWCREQKELAAERARVLRADLDRPVLKQKSTQPTPVLLTGDLCGPNIGGRSY